MEVITIESRVFKEMISKIDEISRYVKKTAENEHEGWIDNKDVSKYLNVSYRTLQRLRSKKLLNYSILGGKTFYKLSEVQRMLDENLIKSTPQCFQELLDYYKTYAK